MKKVEPGQIYRHRKHDPPLFWHEYEVLGIVEPGCPSFEEQPTLKATHTETGDVHSLFFFEHSAYEYGKRWYASPPLKNRHVYYRNTKDNAEGWLRPLDMFLDGRFTLV